MDGWREHRRRKKRFGEWSGEINQMKVFFDFLNFVSSRTFRKKVSKVE